MAIEKNTYSSFENEPKQVIEKIARLEINNTKTKIIAEEAKEIAEANNFEAGENITFTPDIESGKTIISASGGGEYEDITSLGSETTNNSSYTLTFPTDEIDGRELKLYLEFGASGPTVYKVSGCCAVFNVIPKKGFMYGMPEIKTTTIRGDTGALSFSMMVVPNPAHIIIVYTYGVTIEAVEDRPKIFKVERRKI